MNFGRRKVTTEKPKRGGAGTPAAAPSISEAQLQEIFNQFVSEDEPDAMTMDGISALCEQLGLDPSSDVRVLVMLWRLGAKTKPGQLQRSEFVSGMQSLGVGSIDALRNHIPQFDPGFLEAATFREFYRFVFQFSREGTHKTIEKEMIVALLPIVLDRQRAPHLPSFLEFLQASPASVITLDQWDSFLQFNATVPVNLAGLEDDGAWPLLLDEYVEWLRERLGRK